MSPAGHIQKAGEIVGGLSKWIAGNPDAPASEIHGAETVLQDTIAALVGH